MKPTIEKFLINLINPYLVIRLYITIYERKGTKLTKKKD